MIEEKKTTVKCRCVVTEQFECVCPAFSQALLESAQSETVGKKYTFVDLFKTPNIRKLSVCSGIVW